MGGYIKAEAPCERCGWKYKGWHVCFDASKKVPGEGQIDSPRKKSSGSSSLGRTLPERTDEHRANISAANLARWERKRELQRPRDLEIIEKYKGGSGLWDLSKEYGIAYKTVIAIIRREEDATGEVIMRPPGHTNAHRKEVSGGFN